MQPHAEIRLSISTPLQTPSPFQIHWKEGGRIPNYLSRNQNYESIELTATLQLPLGIKPSRGGVQWSSYWGVERCLHDAVSSGARAPAALKLRQCAQPRPSPSAALGAATAAAACDERPSRPEHPEVSLHEKLRFWEFVLKLFHLIVLLFTADYKTSSVPADALPASSRSRAGTFVLTAVVLACVMLVPRPSPCAGVRCHTGVQQPVSQTSCQLAARVRTAMKPPLPKGFAAGSPCLPAHTHT